MVNVKSISSIRCAILSDEKKEKTKYIEFFLSENRAGLFQRLDTIPTQRTGVLKPTKDILYEVRGFGKWVAVKQSVFDQYIAVFNDLRKTRGWDPIVEIIGKY